MDSNNMPPQEPAAHLFPSQKARIEALWEAKFLLDGRESKSIVAQSKGGSVNDMITLSEYILNGTGEPEKRMGTIDVTPHDVGDPYDMRGKMEDNEEEESF